MEDLASMITQFLGSEEGMNQLRAVTEALGLDSPGTGNGGTPPAASNPPPQQAGGTAGGPDLGALFSSLGGGGGSSDAGSPGLDLNTILLLGRAVSAFNQEDRNTELLRALKPHFSQERAKKVDDAIKILQLIRLLPLVKDLGILPSLRGGDGS